MSTLTARYHRPQLECLEDRLTPSVTPDVSLVTSGASGFVNDAIFRQLDALPPGPNSLDTFVRLQTKGKATIGQGFNTDGAVQFDANKGKAHTHALQLGDIPEVVIGGVTYREFVLDVNQKAGQPLISLDQLRLYVGEAGNLSGYNTATHKLAGLTAVYDLDAGGDHWIQLNSQLNKNGVGDLVFLVRSDLFGSDPEAHVYLFSRFGDNAAANGIVEWAVAKSALTPSDSVNDTNSIIHGTVRDEDGNPIQDAILFLDLDDDGERDDNEAWTVSDADGNYSFTGLASGKGSDSIYTVRMLAPQGFVQVGSSPDPVSFDQPILYSVLFDFVVRQEEGPAPS